MILCHLDFSKHLAHTCTMLLYALFFLYIMCPLDEEVANFLTLEQELSCNKWIFLRDVSFPKSTLFTMFPLIPPHLNDAKDIECAIETRVARTSRQTWKFDMFFKESSTQPPFLSISGVEKKNIFLEVSGNEVFVSNHPNNNSLLVRKSVCRTWISKYIAYP